VPIVTALRAAGSGRVAVELDGASWRVLPLEAVVRAGLTVGAELDRGRARTMARERRRLAALAAASRALRARDLSEHGLHMRLARRGVAPVERERAVQTLRRAGLVDDDRFAHRRAETLADRGYGDAFIRDDLERQGVGHDAAEAAIGALRPEHERAVDELVRRGGGLRGGRALARRGFSEESLEGVVARDGPAELG
jgi:SOS response regulatory protein OraA/RecX